MPDPTQNPNFITPMPDAQAEKIQEVPYFERAAADIQTLVTEGLEGEKLKNVLLHYIDDTEAAAERKEIITTASSGKVEVTHTPDELYDQYDAFLNAIGESKPVSMATMLKSIPRAGGIRSGFNTLISNPSTGSAFIGALTDRVLARDTSLNVAAIAQRLGGLPPQPEAITPSEKPTFSNAAGEIEEIVRTQNLSKLESVALMRQFIDKTLTAVSEGSVVSKANGNRYTTEYLYEMYERISDSLGNPENSESIDSLLKSVPRNLGMRRGVELLVTSEATGDVMHAALLQKIFEHKNNSRNRDEDVDLGSLPAIPSFSEEVEDTHEIPVGEKTAHRVHLEDETGEEAVKITVELDDEPLNVESFTKKVENIVASRKQEVMSRLQKLDDLAAEVSITGNILLSVQDWSQEINDITDTLQQNGSVDLINSRLMNVATGLRSERDRLIRATRSVSEGAVIANEANTVLEGMNKEIGALEVRFVEETTAKAPVDVDLEGKLEQFEANLGPIAERFSVKTAEMQAKEKVLIEALDQLLGIIDTESVEVAVAELADVRDALKTVAEKPSESTDSEVSGSIEGYRASFGALSSDMMGVLTAMRAVFDA